MSIACNLHSFIIYHSLLTGFWRIKIPFWALNIFFWASMLPVMFFLSVCWEHTLQRLLWIQLAILCLNLHFVPDNSILWPWRLFIHCQAVLGGTYIHVPLAKGKRWSFQSKVSSRKLLEGIACMYVRKNKQPSVSGLWTWRWRLAVVHPDF